MDQTKSVQNDRTKSLETTLQDKKLVLLLHPKDNIIKIMEDNQCMQCHITTLADVFTRQLEDKFPCPEYEGK